MCSTNLLTVMCKVEASGLFNSKALMQSALTSTPHSTLTSPDCFRPSDKRPAPQNKSSSDSFSPGSSANPGAWLPSCKYSFWLRGNFTLLHIFYRADVTRHGFGFGLWQSVKPTVLDEKTVGPTNDPLVDVAQLFLISDVRLTDNILPRFLLFKDFYVQILILVRIEEMWRMWLKLPFFCSSDIVSMSRSDSSIGSKMLGWSIRASLCVECLSSGRKKWQKIVDTKVPSASKENFLTCETCCGFMQFNFFLVKLDFPSSGCKSMSFVKQLKNVTNIWKFLIT